MGARPDTTLELWPGHVTVTVTEPLFDLTCETTYRYLLTEFCEQLVVLRVAADGEDLALNAS